MDEGTSNAEVKGQTDDVEELRAEIKGLQAKLRGLGQAREQVRLQNIYIATLQSELNEAKEKISAFEAQVGGAQRDGVAPSNQAAARLEETNRELLEMCSGLEAELEKEQKEYDTLFEMYTALEEKSEADKKHWMEEIEAAKSASHAAPPLPAAGVASEQLEMKNFQLEKEKEVVAQLTEQVGALHQEIEKLKEKQRLREKTINDNYEDVIQQLRDDRQRMQLTIDRLKRPKGAEQEESLGEVRAGVNIIGEQAGKAQKVYFAPLRDAERRAYETLIRRLNLQLLEERGRCDVLPPVEPNGCTSNADSRIDSSSSYLTVKEEMKWIKTELLGEQRTLHDGCVKVLDFSSAAARVASTRKMFSIQTQFVEGYWF